MILFHVIFFQYTPILTENKKYSHLSFFIAHDLAI